LPLRESTKPIISKTDVHTLFSSIEGVLAFHRKLHEGFEKLNDEWPCVDAIGDVILRLAPGLKAYNDYVESILCCGDHDILVDVNQISR
jgi:hypothetical protein